MEAGIAFRALRVDERVDLGLEPKLPCPYGKGSIPGLTWRDTYTMSLDEHIESGSEFTHSLYISASRCPIAALFYAMKSYAHRGHEPDELIVAGIDLGPLDGIGGVREHAYIYDMCASVEREMFLQSDKAHNYARKFSEVLLKGVVPPSAIVGHMSLSAICALVRDPQLLFRLRQPVCLGLDCFHDACKGPVENTILKHYGLPVPASVHPERALSVTPVRAQRPISARYEQACRICGSWVRVKDPIVNVAQRGWAHASCAGVQDVPLGQPTRRGGMQMRSRARAAAIARDTFGGNEDIASMPGTYNSWF